MTRVDWIALAIAGLSALSGLKRGLIATALSLAGLAAGAVLGARLAPHFLHNGASSPYTPLVGLGGAVVAAILLQSVASMAGSLARGALAVIPPLKLLDSLGGLAAGAAFGLTIVWVAGAVLLQLPGQTKLRGEIQRSVILQRLNEIAPPRTVLRAFARVDPFPSIAGPAPPSAPPDARVLSTAAVRNTRPSVVKITATACGLGVEGTGWFAGPNTVVTAAHVVAGARGIEAGGKQARAFVVDRNQDVAVLHVSELGAGPPLRLVDPHAGDPVALLGFPENGSFDARPGRIGATADVLVKGRLREVTALSGLVRHGNSGGPAVNDRGEVEAMVFAARIGGSGGYGVPAAPIRAALARAKRPVSTGSC